ncbi:outer membrane protein assembly factor BamB family protein [Advenella kashmirensis]|uniref:outer membrane protein assembly factor BamB family protein n=1 Tax=Advenella kashmirensis TaxID=310575 RepID=UPI00068049F0|nr:PQQ-binding-like beta-propeller repeat protein [Advenella kashmirensis]
MENNHDVSTYASSFSETYSAGRRLALGGCSLFETPSQFEPVDLTEYTQTTVPAAAWTASIGSGSGVGFAPAVAGDSVLAATPDGSVARVALSNGAIQWKTSVGETLSAGVGTDGNIAVVAAPDGKITALDMAGKTLWTAKASTRVSTPPAVGQGVVVVRADDYRVQGFDASSGELLWNYQRTNAALALRAVSRMIIDKGNVLVAVPSGRLVALDLKTGRLQWDILAGPIRGVTDLDSVTDVVGAPVLVGNGVCVATYQATPAAIPPAAATDRHCGRSHFPARQASRCKITHCMPPAFTVKSYAWHWVTANSNGSIRF